MDSIDGRDVYDPRQFTEASFMKLLAYSTKLVSILKEGLANFSSTPNYRQFSKKVGHLVSTVVQYVTDHFNAGNIFVRTIFVQKGKCSPFLEFTPRLRQLP